ncbi:MAG: bifunctional precorrin-2 dehydrogenase/sirohydrochlorin ferrochelatase [Myxococcota bacterium]
MSCAKKGRCPECVDGACVNDVFPVFLKLCDRQAVVIGAGAMAAEKIPALLQAGAKVRVVSPRISPAVEALSVECVQKEFEPQDLDEAWYVVAAAPPPVNRSVSRAAAERRLFVNAVDDVKSADLYLGSVIRRAGMTLSISSNGRAPALTALVRRGLERMLPDELETWLEQAEDLRPRWKAEGLPFAERRPALLRVLNALYREELRP